MTTRKEIILVICLVIGLAFGTVLIFNFTDRQKIVIKQVVAPKIEAVKIIYEDKKVVEFEYDKCRFVVFKYSIGTPIPIHKPKCPNHKEN